MDDVQLDNETLLVTCDVEALYTSIRHTDGLAATQFYLMMSDLDPELNVYRKKTSTNTLLHASSSHPRPLISNIPTGNGDIKKGISPEAMHELRIHREAICLLSPRGKREMSRELCRRIREHVLGIEAAKEETDLQKLKTVPRHFHQYHDCNSTLFKGFENWSCVQ
ncbi:uncharacterized protein LOC130273474 isoform X3 [Hyla sarda]|nr:uncharacterized protein LOC130273474 isoform X3 [Hyla sarda]